MEAVAKTYRYLGEEECQAAPEHEARSRSK